MIFRDNILLFNIETTIGKMDYFSSDRVLQSNFKVPIWYGHPDGECSIPVYRIIGIVFTSSQRSIINILTKACIFWLINKFQIF